MGFFADFLRSMIGGVTVVQMTVDHTETRQVVRGATQRTSSNVQQAASSKKRPESVNAAKPSTTVAQPALIKEPDDLGTPNLPLPDEVSWLNDPQKVRIAIDILNRGGMSYSWREYYVERKAVEEIVSEQEQLYYDRFWQRLRRCWGKLQHPFWKAYLAGHFPNPQAVKDIPDLAKEICVLDVRDFKYRQTQSLIEDEVYTLGMLQNCLFNDHWQPAGINDMDKWHLRKVLVQYGLEVPPSDKPDPIPFAELYIGAFFGVKVTPKKRLSSYSFIQGDEPLESRVRRIQREGLASNYDVSDCEDIMFYLHPETECCRFSWGLHDVRGILKARKILAGGDYPEVRSATVEGVDLDQLEKTSVKDLDLSERAQRRVRQYFASKDIVTLADLVRTYHDWLIYEDTAAAIEIKEHLYQHNYVIRPEDMPMDERTHIAYLDLPMRVRMQLCYPGRVETVDDLLRCCSGNDPVFSLRYAEGIGKKSMDTIKARLVELGFLTDSQ